MVGTTFVPLYRSSPRVHSGYDLDEDVNQHVDWKEVLKQLLHDCQSSWKEAAETLRSTGGISVEIGAALTSFAACGWRRGPYSGGSDDVSLMAGVRTPIHGQLGRRYR